MHFSRMAIGLTASLVAAGAVALPAGPATAAPTDCPTALPTAQAVDGLTGTGYTVERGTTPEPFSANVLGRVADGIAPGIDMILADLSSPALTRAGGVWQGMSGSPVYAADGRLIGSVSYGLASTSTIAGLTPAADMQKLLDLSTASVRGAAAKVATRPKISVSSTIAKRLAGTGEVSAAEASGGFELLKMPMTITGASGARYSKYVKHLQKLAPNTKIRTAGAQATAAAASPSDITAGSNIAAALSYGSVTLAGVGTTTFVCAGKAVGFGHPFNSAGAVQYSAHTADAVTVQPDILSPFKVANPGGVVGVVDQDRTTGIRAVLGSTPSTFNITTRLNVPGGAPASGSTAVVYQPAAPDLAAIHTMTMIDSLRQSFGPGSAALRFTVTGTRANGASFTVSVKDHIADPGDLSGAVASRLFDVVSPLINQPYEKITLTGVSVTGEVTDDVNLYRVTSFKVANSKGTWIKAPSTIKVSQGHVIKTQVTLTKYQSTTKIVVPISVRAPAGTSGLTGTLDVAGGPTFEGTPDEVTSFPSLLKALAAQPGSDQLTEILTLETGNKPLKVTSAKHIAGGVDFYSQQYEVLVK
jgi:SpoIVB peptidase S55